MSEVNYRRINHEVMSDTKKRYESDKLISAMVRQSVAKQYMVSHEETIELQAEAEYRKEYIRHFRNAGSNFQLLEPDF